MNIRSGNRRREEATIELTPLIDVVFLLLIFFLLTSALAKPNDATTQESSIPIALPSAQSGSKAVTGNPVVLNITEQGQVVLEGGDTLGGETIEQKILDLYQKDPKAQILLRGDKGASHGKVIELLDAVKQIGFKKVDLVISPAAAKP